MKSFVSPKALLQSIGRYCYKIILLSCVPALCYGSDCSQTSVGWKPLDELGTGTYMGVPGGLYPGSSNVRPAAHEAAGLSLARGITPLDANGVADSAGKYVLISIGMSNTTQEFQRFLAETNNDTELDPNLVIVDGAQSGQVASIVANPASEFWDVVNVRLSSSGVTNNQVAVAWVKVANIADTSTDVYRSVLQSDIEEISRVLLNKFPNIRLIYFSSRIYAGYASTDLNPEPYAYESGFVVRQVIEKQLNGDSSLNFDSSRGAVVAPWLSWGAYLWGDGLVPRSDGSVWECADFESDGTHPSSSGERKVAIMLVDFFKNDTTAREWFLADPPIVDTVPPAAPQNLVVEP